MVESYQTWENLKAVSDLRGMANVRSFASDAIQSQYAASKRLTRLARVIQRAIDPSEEIQYIAENVVNPYKAKGVFLDWIGKRVGISREVVIDGVKRTIDDESFRFLIFYKCASNISDSSIATMNRLLTQLLGFPVYVVDNQDMTISVRVLGVPDEIKQQILISYGLLTRACGVGWNLIIFNPANKIFGFNGSKLHTFNQGTFNNANEVTGQ